MIFGSVEGNVEYVNVGQWVYACLYVYPICVDGMKHVMVAHLTWAVLDTQDNSTGKVQRQDQKRRNSSIKSGVGTNKNMLAPFHWADFWVFFWGTLANTPKIAKWMFIPVHSHVFRPFFQERLSLWLSHPSTEESRNWRWDALRVYCWKLAPVCSHVPIDLTLLSRFWISSHPVTPSCVGWKIGATACTVVFNTTWKCSSSLYGGFLEWGYPQNHQFL